jgi:hypothetical protein
MLINMAKPNIRVIVISATKKTNSRTSETMNFLFNFLVRSSNEHKPAKKKKRVIKRILKLLLPKVTFNINGDFIISK